MKMQEVLSVTEALRQHAVRDFGGRGLRELTLAVFNDGASVFTYRILHAWLVEAHVCQSVFLLREPSVLRGTLLKIVERPFVAQMDVWLKLGHGGLRPIEPSRHRQSVLGTDFTYEDLRFWLPTDSFEDTGPGRINIDGILSFSASYRTGNALVPLRVALDTANWLAVLIEWLASSDGETLRSYSADDIINVNGIWTPQRICISRPHEGYRSVMTLGNIASGISIDPLLFETRTLTSAIPPMFDAWSHELARR